jgi:hypothetical protein
MTSANQNYLDAVGLAKRLMSQDPSEQEATWNLIWRKRSSRRWLNVLRLLIGVLVREYGVQGAQMAQRWLRGSGAAANHARG